MVAAGVPVDYTKVLRLLTATVASGNGSRPNNDVLTVTGGPPIGFAGFAAEFAPSGSNPPMDVRNTTVNPPIANLEDFAALDPFFRIIEQGLEGIVEAGHFFDLMAEDVVTEYVITVPGYPPRIEGRQALAELYRPYGTAIELDRCFDLAVYHDPGKGVAVLEYASEGHTVDGNRPYANRFISVITIRDGEIVHWRDYLNPVAVFNALGWPPK